MSSVPQSAPSNLNCTPTTPTLSVALANTVTFSETMTPQAGLIVMVTDDMENGVLSTGMARRGLYPQKGYQEGRSHHVQ